MRAKSAFELLNDRIAQQQEEKAAKEESEPALRSTSRRQEKSTFEEVISSPVAKQVGRELVRGVFGVLFGTTVRRSTSRRKGGIF